MTDPRERLDQVDARTNTATDGPWIYGGQGWVFGPSTEHTRDDDILATVTDDETGVFIAHARTDLPAATAALRAVLDLLDQVEGEDEWALVHTDDIRAAITTALEDA